MPYLWQYKDANDTSWTNYDKQSNENIEKAFCDPSKSRSGHTDDLKLEVWFHQIPLIHEKHFANGFTLHRRLSTRSSVTVDDSTKIHLTHWKWYWEKSNNVWEEYMIGVGLRLYHIILYICILMIYILYACMYIFIFNSKKNFFRFSIDGT